MNGVMKQWAVEMARLQAREQCAICGGAVRRVRSQALARCCTECAAGNVDLTDCAVAELVVTSCVEATAMVSA